MMTTTFVSDLQTLEGIVGNKVLAYGTVVYLPADFRIDFGKSEWPSPYEKKKVCPRVLLATSWTDNRMGFVGGNAKRGELPLDSMNREFEEEMGSPGEFSSEHFRFASLLEESNGKKTITYNYCRITHDEGYFNSLLGNFYTNSQRKAYVNEVIGCCGLLPVALIANWCA